MGKTTYQPKVRFRVLATHWEAELYTECWCEDEESARRVEAALKAWAPAGDTTVQINRVEK